YEGKVLLEINPEEPQVLNFREVAQEAPTVDVDSYRETQYKVLRSRTLAEKVVNDLHLYQSPEFYRYRGLFGLYESDPEKIPSSERPKTSCRHTPRRTPSSTSPKSKTWRLPAWRNFSRRTPRPSRSVSRRNPSTAWSRRARSRTCPACFRTGWSRIWRFAWRT